MEDKEVTRRGLGRRNGASPRSLPHLVMRRWLETGEKAIRGDPEEIVRKTKGVEMSVEQRWGW